MRVISRSVGAIALGLTITGFALVGCDLAGGGNSTPEEPEEIWLSELKNPFIGEWSAAIPSMGGATLDFKFETNGTFEASSGGQTFVGAYVAQNGYQTTWLDFEGIGMYSYKVIDNNTISVTEGEYSEDGVFKPHATTLFKRKTGSAVIKTDSETNLAKPFNADNNLTGAWKALLPPEEGNPVYSQSIQVFLPNGEYQYINVDPYMFMPIRYSTIGDIFFVDMPPIGAEAFQYETLPDGNITVTPILGINPDGSRNLDIGRATPYTKIW
ncbi:MAG: hypothetical protein LBO72_07585 [Helicobacteraceae bacterium]|jgi:hypothetical protein|nr:hypothetical protein [Helicobacteraceae bacterium]